MHVCDGPNAKNDAVHHARCEERPFQAGDYVRWEHRGDWAVGVVESVAAEGYLPTLMMTFISTNSTPRPRDMVLRRHCRHIPGPGEERLQTIDGMTRAQCLAEFSLVQKGVERHRRLSPAQLAAAREEWSAELRRRVKPG